MRRTQVFFRTYGCRVNQYETQTLKERLFSEGGMEETACFETADLCVLNTCTVTEEADKDALLLARRIARRNPAARLVVTGCLATRSPEKVLEAAPNALVAGNAEKPALAALLGCSPVPAYAGIRGFSGRARAFVKLQDGCNMNCTYCVIPSVRPVLWSKPWPELESEIKGLIAEGYQEIVLCGVRLGRYLSRDGENRRVDFVSALERIAAFDGDFRVRLSSFEITDLTDRFLELFKTLGPRLCRSLHIPLQSGSEEILRAMQRWYSAVFYARRIAAVRSACSEVGLFSDVMVGFPGESKARFQESLAFIRSMGFSGLHIFRYSSRPGTPAVKMAGQIPLAEVSERSERMHELDGKLRAEFAKSWVGSVRTVLVENRSEGYTENFLRVRLQALESAAQSRLQGLQRARIVKTEKQEAWGSILPNGALP